MSNIKPDKLEFTIKEYLENYREDIQEEVEQTTTEITKQARDELKEKSRSMFKIKDKNSPYWKGWTIKVQKSGKLRYSKVIWNKTDYQLTHLLEFGHTTRNGGRTREFPHIRPVEEKYKVKFVDLLKQRIRRTK